MGDPQEGGRQAVGNMLLAGIAGLAGLAAASQGNARALPLDQQSLDPSSNEGTTGTARSGLFEFPSAVPSPAASQGNTRALFLDQQSVDPSSNEGTTGTARSGLFSFPSAVPSPNGPPPERPVVGLVSSPDLKLDDDEQHLGNGSASILQPDPTSRPGGDAGPGISGKAPDGPLPTDGPLPEDSDGTGEPSPGGDAGPGISGKAPDGPLPEDSDGTGEPSPGGDAGPGISGKASDGPFPEDSDGTGEPTSIEDGKLPSVTKSGTADKAEPSSEEILGDSLLPDNMGGDVPRAWSPGGTDGATIQGVEGTKQARRSYVLYYAAVAGAILVLLALLATIAVHVAGRSKFTGAQTAPSPVVITGHDEEAPTCSGPGDHCASHPEGADNKNCPVTILDGALPGGGYSERRLVDPELPPDLSTAAAGSSHKEIAADDNRSITVWHGSSPEEDLPTRLNPEHSWNQPTAAAERLHNQIVEVDNPAYLASGSDGMSSSTGDLPTRVDDLEQPSIASDASLHNKVLLADNPAYSASASDGSPPKADIPLHVHHRKMPWGLFYLGPRTAGCASAATRHHGIVAEDNPAFSASGSEGSPTGADIPTRADHEAPGGLSGCADATSRNGKSPDIPGVHTTWTGAV